MNFGLVPHLPFVYYIYVCKIEGVTRSIKKTLAEVDKKQLQQDQKLIYDLKLN